MIKRLRMLAIDPSLRGTGYAYFDAGQLRKAGIVRTAATEPVEAAAFIGRELAVRLSCEHLDHLVVEVPQVYQARHSVGDPNDLISIALVAGATLQIPASYRVGVFPHAWKGNTPKEIMTKRIWSALSTEDKQLLDGVPCPPSLLHNVLDAVGLGFWHWRKVRI